MYNDKKQISVETRYCSVCGAPIPRNDYSPSIYKKRKYCSMECAAKAPSHRKGRKKNV